jgi:hypothetical protein
MIEYGGGRRAYAKIHGREAVNVDFCQPTVYVQYNHDCK